MTQSLLIFGEFIESVYDIDDPRQQLDILEKYKRLLELEQELIASGSASHAERTTNEILDIKKGLE